MWLKSSVSNIPRTVMLTFQVDLYKTVNRLENGYLVVDLRVKPAKPVGWAHAFTMRSHVTANTTLSTLVCMHTVKQINSPVVTMVAWFTVVVEANCIRPPVSLLFPHSGIRIRGEKNKETTPLVVIASVWYQHKPSVVKTTLVEYARVSEFSTVQVLYSDRKTCSLYAIVRCPHLAVFLSIVLIALQSGPCQVAT